MRETKKLLGCVQIQDKRERHVFNSSGSRWTKQRDKHILYLNQVLHDEHPQKIQAVSREQAVIVL